MELNNRDVDLDELQPHPKNYNRHPPEQVRRLAKSLTKFGQVRSVVVWRMFILAGHGVVEAARILNWRTVRADVLPDDYPEHLALAYIAADNELAKQGDPDMAQLAAILEESKAADADLLEAIGYSDKEFEALLKEVGKGAAGVEDAGAQVDKADELRQKWQTEPGQLWQLGEHRLICGDCTDPATVARVMGGERADMLLTDPPYGVSYADKNKWLNAVAKGNRIQTPIENDHGNIEETAHAIWLPAFSLALECCCDTSSFYVFMPQGGDQMMMMMMMVEAGWVPRHELIWLKNNHVLGRADYNYKHEPILYGWKRKGTHHFYGDFQTSVIECKKPQNSDLHPTTKPLELIERLIPNNTQAGEIVYDPFVGSGTTIIACENLGRRCIACEIGAPYTAVCLERWAMSTGKTPVLVEGEG